MIEFKASYDWSEVFFGRDFLNHSPQLMVTVMHRNSHVSTLTEFQFATTTQHLRYFKDKWKQMWLYIAGSYLKELIFKSQVSKYSNIQEGIK